MSSRTKIAKLTLNTLQNTKMYAQRREDHTYKFAVLGDGAVGKTSLTVSYCHNHFVECYDPTIEDCYRRQKLVDDRACLIEILDTAGQEEFSALRDQWIRESEGYVLVYSIISRDTFNAISSLASAIHRVVEKDKVPIILVANKSDLEAKRQVTKDEGVQLARSIGATFVEASAKTRAGVEEAFDAGVRLIQQIRAGDKKMDNKKSGRKLAMLSKRDGCSIL